MCAPDLPAEKTFLPVLTLCRLWWMCIELPGSFSIGLARKVAYTPWRIAASRMVRLNRNTWSARESGSRCTKFTSSWAAPDSCTRVSTSRSMASQ